MKLRRPYSVFQLGALRAGIAIFCALFLIACPVAHGVLHASQPLPAVGGEVSAPDEGHGSGPVETAFDVTHCHCCTAVSAPGFVILAELSARSSATKIARTEIATLSPRVFDPPPPKS